MRPPPAPALSCIRVTVELESTHPNTHAPRCVSALACPLRLRPVLSLSLLRVALPINAKRLANSCLTPTPAAQLAGRALRLTWARDRQRAAHTALGWEGGGSPAVAPFAGQGRAAAPPGGDIAAMLPVMAASPGALLFRCRCPLLLLLAQPPPLPAALPKIMLQH